MAKHALRDGGETVWDMRRRLLPDVKTWLAWSDAWDEGWIHSACLCGYGSGGLYYLDGGAGYQETMFHFAKKHTCFPYRRKTTASHTLKAAARRHRERIYYDFH